MPRLDPLLGGKNSFAPVIVYARSTSIFTSVSSVAMPSAFTSNVGPIDRMLGSDEGIRAMSYVAVIGTDPGKSNPGMPVWNIWILPESKDA